MKVISMSKECYATLTMNDDKLEYAQHLVNSIRYFDKERPIFALTEDDLELEGATTYKYDMLRKPPRKYLYVTRSKPYGIYKLLKEGYKIFYLDSDCLVLDDITEIFNNKEDITACVDEGWPNQIPPSFHHKSVEVKGGTYINSGVMFINDTKAWQLASDICMSEKEYKQVWDIRNPNVKYESVKDSNLVVHNLMEQDIINYSIYKTQSSLNILDNKIFNYHGHLGDYEKLKPQDLRVLHWSGGPNAPSIRKRIEFIEEWNPEYYKYLHEVAKV